MMRVIEKIIVFVVITQLSGCAWFKGKETVFLKTYKYVDSGRIVDPSRLNEGGDLLIIPFAAGPNVEANDKLQKISLIIVKGISDILSNSGTKLNILIEEGSKADDLSMKGHVIKITKPGKFNKWILRKRKKELTVEGRLVDDKTNKVILYFSRGRMTDKTHKNHNDLAYHIGQDIGRFILSGIE